MKRLVFLVSLLLIVSLTVACERGQKLPDYVHRDSDGAVRIDIGEASGGASQLREGVTMVRFGEYKTRFALFAVSGHREVSLKALKDPPIKISSMITPGDSIADIFMAVWVDQETQELHITFFLDTDWEEIVEGQLFIHTWETYQDGITDPHGRVYPIDFSKAKEGVYFRELKFQPEDNAPGYESRWPIVSVTNMSGGPREVSMKAAALKLEDNDINIYIFAAPEY